MKKKDKMLPVTTQDYINNISQNVITQKAQLIELSNIVFGITGKQLKADVPVTINEGDNIHSLVRGVSLNANCNTFNLQHIINTLNKQFNLK